MALAAAGRRGGGAAADLGDDAHHKARVGADLLVFPTRDQDAEMKAGTFDFDTACGVAERVPGAGAGGIRGRATAAERARRIRALDAAAMTAAEANEAAADARNLTEFEDLVTRSIDRIGDDEGATRAEGRRVQICRFVRRAACERVFRPAVPAAADGTGAEPEIEIRPAVVEDGVIALAGQVRLDAYSITPDANRQLATRTGRDTGAYNRLRALVEGAMVATRDEVVNALTFHRRAEIAKLETLLDRRQGNLEEAEALAGAGGPAAGAAAAPPMGGATVHGGPPVDDVEVARAKLRKTDGELRAIRDRIRDTANRIIDGGEIETVADLVKDAPTRIAHRLLALLAQNLGRVQPVERAKWERNVPKHIVNLLPSQTLPTATELREATVRDFHLADSNEAYTGAPPEGHWKAVEKLTILNVLQRGLAIGMSPNMAALAGKMVALAIKARLLGYQFQREWRPVTAADLGRSVETLSHGRKGALAGVMLARAATTCHSSGHHLTIRQEFSLKEEMDKLALGTGDPECMAPEFNEPWEYLLLRYAIPKLFPQRWTSLFLYIGLPLCGMSFRSVELRMDALPAGFGDLRSGLEFIDYALSIVETMTTDVTSERIEAIKLEFKEVRHFLVTEAPKLNLAAPSAAHEYGAREALPVMGIKRARAATALAAEVVDAAATMGLTNRASVQGKLDAPALRKLRQEEALGTGADMMALRAIVLSSKKATANMAREYAAAKPKMLTTREKKQPRLTGDALKALEGPKPDDDAVSMSSAMT
eukprot:TRINITY_DN65994_c0_g1_i1.p1 TRINITY_DN65994_c0_g1~~TRINITY_DN65994_c0_g1_i1.p1  ORF type:complete len:768 (+),score=247.62 TRINITY_DN65994_c0_g1_i1:86-2389(+)